MPQDLTDDKSTVVQVMAWCCQATSHYLCQCWLSSLLPYGVARPQWVNEISQNQSSMVMKEVPIAIVSLGTRTCGGLVIKIISHWQHIIIELCNKLKVQVYTHFKDPKRVLQRHKGCNNNQWVSEWTLRCDQNPAYHFLKSPKENVHTIANKLVERRFSVVLHL